MLQNEQSKKLLAANMTILINLDILSYLIPMVHICLIKRGNKHLRENRKTIHFLNIYF